MSMPTPNSPAKMSANEFLKESDPTLGGTIGQTLADPQADHFVEDDTQFLKFHGVYQQETGNCARRARGVSSWCASGFPAAC